MREVGVLEAKTNLSALVTEVEKTREPIAITRRGKRIARIEPEPVETSRSERLQARKVRDWKAWVADLRRRQDEAAALNPLLLEPYDLREDRDAIE